MKEAVIVSAARTPVGRMRGMFASLEAIDLGAAAIKAAVERAEIDPACIDDVIFGNLGNDNYANLSRVALLKAGLPITVPGFTIDRQCSSGLNAIALAAMMIESGHGEVFVAGGVESDSTRPYLMNRAKQAYQLNPPEWGMRYTGPEGYNYSMGETAENLCDKYGITREMQDEFAVASQSKAEAAVKGGKFKDEIVPVVIHGKKGDTVFDTDEYPKFGTTLEKVAKLKPAFKKDGGTVTAANASGINDSAAAFVVMSQEKAEELLEKLKNSQTESAKTRISQLEMEWKDRKEALAYYEV